ncbi:MAG TPA: aldo/keto reductase [Nevskiaceae bacterium]
MTTLRRIAGREVFPVGLGCMGLTHAYGAPIPPEQAEAVLLGALDLGVTLFDTAALYSFGANEELVGRVLAPHRDEIFLASKCGIFRGPDGKRAIDGRPETLRRTCDESLARLKTDVIDLYYLHRWDKSVPIEDSVGALADMVRAGKVRAIGLSEVSAGTLRKAAAVHPIAAVQSEYSLWSRNAEIAVLAACRELGAAFVAFSPVGRGFLADGIPDIEGLAPRDIRRAMPRFQAESFRRNGELMKPLRALADRKGCSVSQLALAWLLHQGDDIIPIPGTTSLDHLQDNVRAAEIELDQQSASQLSAMFPRDAVTGARYPAARQVEIDTEQYASR